MSGYLPPSLFQNKSVARNKYVAPTASVSAPTSAGLGDQAAAALGPVIAMLNKRAQPQASTPSQSDLIDQLMQMALKSGGGGMASMAQLQQQARSAAASTYDPQIAAIQNLMAQARTDTRNQQGVVKSTYKDLAGTYAGDVKVTKADAKMMREQEKARASDQTDAIKDSYADSMQMITDQLNQLGIQQAGQDILPQLATDMGQNTMQAANESATQTGAINTREGGDLSYYNSGANVANLAGAEGVQGLSQALQKYLFQQQGEIGSLQTQKANAYQSALQQLQQQAAQQASQAQNDTWDRLLQIAKLKQDSSKTQTADKFGLGFSGASQYLTQQFNESQWGPQEGQRYLGILQGLIANLGSQGRQYNDEQMMNEAVMEANRRGISPSVLQRAMAAYLGKG